MAFESMLSISYIIATFISAIIAFIVIVISDKIIAHNIDIKHSFIMAIIALFVGPIVGALIVTYANVAIPFFSSIILPLILWIILGEVLLKEGGMITKLKVIIIAFVVFEILELYVFPMVWGFVPL
jgi:hypothetical protein